MTMRSQLLVSVLLVLIARQPADADEEYFKKSVFKALKEKNGQFSSEYNVRSSTNNSILANDRFSFKLNIHDLAVKSNLLGSRRLLFVNASEVYIVNEQTRDCMTNPFNKTMLKKTLTSIAKEEVFNPELNYQVFGANSLLEVLHENQEKNKDSVKCEDGKDTKKKNPKKCTITFKEAAKVEYHLVDKDAQTMIPEKIVTYTKQDKDWKVQTEITYRSFTPSFDAKPIVNASIPVGFGCKRLNQENSPRIQPFFTPKFETEIEIRANISQKSSEPKSEKVTLKTIQIKVNANLEKGMVVAHTVDKETSMNITTLLDTKNKVLYNINTAANVCYKMKAPPEASAPANLSKLEIQEQLMKQAENITFLGEYLVDQVLCNAFEFKLDDSLLMRGNPPEKFERRQYTADLVTITAYYPSDPKHWSKTETVWLAKRVEVRLFDRMASKEFVKVMLDVKSFNLNPKDPEKIDTSKCSDMNPMVMG